MPPSTPQQQFRRDRVESLIGLAAPALDLLLAVGDRIARIVERDDDYIPIRSAGEAFELGPADRVSRREPPAPTAPPSSSSA